MLGPPRLPPTRAALGAQRQSPGADVADRLPLLKLRASGAVTVPPQPQRGSVRQRGGRAQNHRALAAGVRQGAPPTATAAQRRARRRLAVGGQDRSILVFAVDVGAATARRPRRRRSGRECIGEPRKSRRRCGPVAGPPLLSAARPCEYSEPPWQGESTRVAVSTPSARLDVAAVRVDVELRTPEHRPAAVDAAQRQGRAP